MLTPNLLITNYCNQNCSFCFARKEMNKLSLKKNMSLKTFSVILKKLKNKKIKLLGGEPTLHPQFNKFVNLSIKQSPEVEIFTNGVFNKAKFTFLKNRLDKVKFIFNISTPGFQQNVIIRRHVLANIKSISVLTSVSLSITVDPYTNIRSIIKKLPIDIILRLSSVRIGISNPMLGSNYYEFSQFKKIGSLIYFLVKQFKKISPSIEINQNCGLVRCMFSQAEYNYLKKINFLVDYWGCFGKTSSMDISTDGTAFNCFPLSSIIRKKICGKELVSFNFLFIKNRLRLRKKFINKRCLKCSFNGPFPPQCSGPCLAFLINQQNINTKH